MRAWSETANSTTSALAFPPSRTSWERRTAVTFENASAASATAADRDHDGPIAIHSASPI